MQVFALMCDAGMDYVPYQCIGVDKDEALLHFARLDPSCKTFFNRINMAYSIIHYAMYHVDTLSTQPETTVHVDLEDDNTVVRAVSGKLVLKQWGIDIDDFTDDGTHLFVPVGDNLNINPEIFNSIHQEFLKLSDEKQLNISKILIEQSAYTIRSRPIEIISGLERLIKPYEDKMNQMRVDTAKVMRRNVPPELFEIVAGHLKS